MRETRNADTVYRPFRPETRMFVVGAPCLTKSLMQRYKVADE